MDSKHRRGFAITRDSLRVFTRKPTLVILPALSLLAVGSAFAVLAAIAFQQGLVESLLTNDLYKYGALFCMVTISSSVATFFNDAVVLCAAQLFDETQRQFEMGSLRRGVPAARSLCGLSSLRRSGRSCTSSSISELLSIVWASAYAHIYVQGIVS